MERIQIPMSSFVRYVATSRHLRDRLAGEIHSMIRSEYQPAQDYWKKPMEAIRWSVASGDSPENLRDLELDSKDANRRKNYSMALTEFVSWWDHLQPSSARVPGSALVMIGPFNVKVNPDLAVKVGRARYAIRVRFVKGAELLTSERVATTSLLAEAFDDHLPAILDLCSGEFSSRSTTDREMLEKAAADLESRWPAE